MSPSTNNKYQTTGESVNRRGDFWCACVSAEEIKVDKARDGRKGKLGRRVWRKAGQRKVKERTERGKMRDGLFGFDHRFVNRLKRCTAAILEAHIQKERSEKFTGRSTTTEQLVARVD